MQNAAGRYLCDRFQHPPTKQIAPHTYVLLKLLILKRYGWCLSRDTQLPFDFSITDLYRLLYSGLLC